MRLTRLLVLALAAAASSACGGTGAAPDPRPGGQEVRPWKAYFSAPQALVADEVRIVGPEGLLEHVALGHDPTAHVYTTETVPEGLLQVVELRPGVNAVDAPIQVALDALDMRVLRRVEVLEKVGLPPLEVLAEGNVWWAREDGRGEVREASLRLPGSLPVGLLEAVSSEDVFDEWN